MGYHLRAKAAARPRAEGRATRGACTPRAGVGSGYRYYNPELGRWVNRDPIGERGGSNVYCAFGNRSMDHVDLLGLLFRRRRFRAEAVLYLNDTVRDGIPYYNVAIEHHLPRRRDAIQVVRDRSVITISSGGARASVIRHRLTVDLWQYARHRRTAGRRRGGYVVSDSYVTGFPHFPDGRTALLCEYENRADSTLYLGNPRSVEAFFAERGIRPDPDRPDVIQIAGVEEEPGLGTAAAFDEWLTNMDEHAAAYSFALIYRWQRDWRHGNHRREFSTEGDIRTVSHW